MHVNTPTPEESEVEWMSLSENIGGRQLFFIMKWDLEELKSQKKKLIKCNINHVQTASHGEVLHKNQI